LTVFDKAGAMGAVSLPGRGAKAELFRDPPFEPDAIDSSGALLNALVASEARSPAGHERALAGLAENRATERRRLSIGFVGEGTRDAAISKIAAAP
jgi:hypothetical protein